MRAAWAAALLTLLWVSSSEARWVKQIRKSEMDGRITVMFGTISTNEIAGPLGRGSRPSLYIRCSQGDAELFLASDTMFETSDDKSVIRVKYDEADPLPGIGDESTSHKALFLAAADPLPVIAQLFKTKVLRIEFTPFQSGPVVARFDVTGLKSHAKELTTHCGLTVP